MKNAEKLINDIYKLKLKWNERSSFKLKGVSNLSMADLDTLDLYANEYIRNQGMSFGSFMQPFGETKDVLDAYGIKAMY